MHQHPVEALGQIGVQGPEIGQAVFDDRGEIAGGEPAEKLRRLPVEAVQGGHSLGHGEQEDVAQAEKVQAETLKAIAKRPAAYPAVIVTSAEKGDGMPELRAEIMRTTGAVL